MTKRILISLQEEEHAELLRICNGNLSRHLVQCGLGKEPLGLTEEAQKILKSQPAEFASLAIVAYKRHIDRLGMGWNKHKRLFEQDEEENQEDNRKDTQCR